MSIIKVGFLISYDYEYIKTSLPRVYDHVDQIYFAVDADRKTWAGKPLEIDDQFWAWIKEFDKAGKITIYEDHFYVAGLSPIECDTRERNLLGQYMGKADWYVQVDSDEYFVDFPAFVSKLRGYIPDQPTTIACKVLTLFKELSDGFLFIDDSVETLNFATNNPVYDIARINQSGNLCLLWDDLVLHQSWARKPDEIYRKLHNWGHKDDFNLDSFYNLWNAIDRYNYHVLNNFHPLDPRLWPKLTYAGGSIAEILNSASLREIGSRKDKKVRKKSWFSRTWRGIKSRIKS